MLSFVCWQPDYETTLPLSGNRLDVRQRNRLPPDIMIYTVSTAPAALILLLGGDQAVAVAKVLIGASPSVGHAT